MMKNIALLLSIVTAFRSPIYNGQRIGEKNWPPFIEKTHREQTDSHLVTIDAFPYCEFKYVKACTE